MSYSYASQKFSSARSALMLPHTHGEAQSIATAFFECAQGLDRFDQSLLDEHSKKWVQELQQLMRTEGISDPDKEGLFLNKAKKLSVDEQLKLSQLVDDLQCWFGRHKD